MPSDDIKTEVHRIEGEIKQCVLDISKLQETEKLADMARSKAAAEKHGRLITTDDASRITRLLTSLKKLEKEETDLIKENEELATKVDRINKAVDEKHEVLATLRESTCHMHGDVFALENESTRLKKQLTALKDEQGRVKATLADKNNKLERLIKLLNTYNELEEQHLNVTTALKVKKAELSDVKQEEDTLKRIETRKLQLLDKVSKDNVRNDVRVLEGEKRSLHTRIQNRQKQKDVYQRAIVTHGYEIAQLERQLSFFADALKSAGVQMKPDRPGISSDALDAPVHVSLLEEALSLVTARRRALDDREAMLETRDAQIEGLEQRVSILSRATHVASRLAQQSLKSQSQEYAHMQHLMEQRQNMFEEASEKLKEQQDYLRRKLEKANHVPAGQQ
eukprot:PhM_4_TR4891/c1_g1_i1/m.80669